MAATYVRITTEKCRKTPEYVHNIEKEMHSTFLKTANRKCTTIEMIMHENMKIKKNV